MKPTLPAFVLVFILMVPVGTLTHELGHYIAARAYVSNAQLHYQRVSFTGPIDSAFVQLMKDYEDTVKRKTITGAYYHKVVKNYVNEHIYVTVAGPFQTLLTALTGLSILIYRRLKRLNVKFNQLDWMAAFMVLFASRFVFNTLLGLGNNLFFGRSSKADETKLAAYNNLNEFAIELPLFILSTLILLLLVFKLIPRESRKNFIVAGIVGSACGWIFWMDFLGPLLLP